MAGSRVKVKLNRASIRLDNTVMRQIEGSTLRKETLLRAYKRAGPTQRWEKQTQEGLNRLYVVLMSIFRGGVTGITGPVHSVFGVPVAWSPLDSTYVKYKKTRSFWLESGDLLNYASVALSPLAGTSAVRKMEIKAGKVPRGAKSLRVSALITPARLPEPFQSLVMYPFLQGDGNDVSGAGSQDFQARKLLVNHALRGFLPEVSEAFGKQLLEELRS